MSTVKISQLPLITALNANTANSLFMGVDIPTGVTGKFTAHTLAANLYSNEILNVGVNQQNLPNTIAQFSLGGQSYIQTNLVNTDDGGTADIVVTANVGSGGTDAANFIDMGYANKNYQPGSAFNNIGNAVNPKDGYLYVQGTAGSNGGNLIVGTTTSNTTLKFIVGGGTSANIVASMTSNSLVLNTQSFITFADGTKQITAAASNAYSQAAFAAANTAAANISVIQGVAYGKENGSILYANNNLIVASNTVVINESAGTVYIPNGLQANTRSYSGNQTSATLNFLTDTWVHANLTANFAVTLGNFTPGSEIHLWITNVGGPARTITHGCSALNSTVGATTFSLGGGTSARLKYYSFDGNLANTYVTVSYS